MRILHVVRTLNPAWGGQIEAVRNLASVARLDGVEVEVLAVDAVESEWGKQWPCTTHQSGAGRFTYGYTPKLDEWLSQHISKFDAVIVNGIWMYLSTAVRKAAKRHDIPYFVFAHGSLDPWFQKYKLKHLKKQIYWRLIEHKVVRDAEAVLFTTEEERQLAQNAFTPYDCRQLVVTFGIAAPPATQRVTKDEARRAMRNAVPGMKERKYLLFLGRIHEKKGIGLLLEGFQRARRGEEALLIAGPGDGATVSRLRRLTAQLGLENDVIWSGPLYGDEKWMAFRGAEAFVLPSHQENFGISAVEALACGTPILISDKVNIWREVAGEGAGLVESDDIAGTVKLLERWQGLGDREKRDMGAKAVHCYARHFDLSKTSQQLHEIVRETAASPMATR